MKAGVKISGAKETAASIRNAGERVVDNGRKIMHRISDKIVEEAVLNAPVDKHNLEESIKKSVSYGYRGRLQIDIEVGGVVNGVDVSAYAVHVHENYSSMNPGPGTVAKRNSNPGRYIGEKFLERAVKDYEETLNKAIMQVVNREWHL
jgi:hypothetical protein